ncbi:MAG: carboxypeptidase regulatory-like domain-containing protein, partial [Nitriliruptoraceae bacterium]|nr:carboxypeptidase regulatory-like domain-containing protein [Nitriliruptoraceae bacterium]
MHDLGLDETTELPRLRVELLTPVVQVTVGQPVTVSLRIVNTTPVIETISIELLALMAESTQQHPERITLFPEESLEAELELIFTPALPAGSHEGLVVVRGGSGSVLPTELPLIVEVPSGPALGLQAEPPQRTGGRSERFEVLLDNVGNTPLDLRLRAVDAERVCELSFNRPRQTLRVAQSTGIDLLVRAKRKWAGAPIEHVITITADADEVVETAEIRYRQKAVFTPGVITVLTLALIVGLWAAVMLFGIERVFSDPPQTKTVPASFTEGIGNDTLDPLLVGGGVAGTVVASSTDAPVERVTIEVFAVDGSLVGATATAADGTYELDGLLPGRYRLRMRATGFTERWWPDATDPTGALELPVGAGAHALAPAPPEHGPPPPPGGVVVGRGRGP